MIMLRADYPTLLFWRGGTNRPGSRPAGSEIVTECLFIHPMVIKYIYNIYSRGVANHLRMWMLRKRGLRVLSY